MLVDEEETRRIERRLIWLLHCSLRLLDDKDKSDWLDSVDGNRVEEEDEEAAEVVDEPLVDDDDYSSRTIDLKKEF